MELVLWLLLVASVLHVVEEWYWPGGFLPWFKTFVRFAEGLTPPIAVAVNVAFLAAVLGAALAGDANPRFGLSMAALCFVNGALHVIGTAVTDRYSPGVVTGALLYLPLAVAAYAAAPDSVDTGDFVVAILLGAGYQAAAIAVMVLRLRVSARSS